MNAQSVQQKTWNTPAGQSRQDMGHVTRLEVLGDGLRIAGQQPLQASPGLLTSLQEDLPDAVALPLQLQLLGGNGGDLRTAAPLLDGLGTAACSCK